MRATIPGQWQRAVQANASRRASLSKMGLFVKSGRTAPDGQAFRTQRSVGHEKLAPDFVSAILCGRQILDSVVLFICHSERSRGISSYSLRKYRYLGFPRDA